MNHVTGNPIEPTVAELFDLRGRSALITGGSGYLGRSLSTALAEAGARVAIGSRDKFRAEQVASRLPCPARQDHCGVVLDYLSEPSIVAGAAAAAKKLGAIDILVNNGHAALNQDWRDVSYEQFTRQLANAGGYFLLSRIVRDQAVARGTPASIVMMGSMYGLVGSYPDSYTGISQASPVAYHTLKGGLHQMTRHLAVYWAADGVRVNAICPGPFPDPARASEAMVDRLRERVPLGRMGEPSELKGAVVFLSGSASSYMTGQLLVIDGGWTAW